MYKVVLNMETIGQFTTFKQAFTCLFHRLKRELSAGMSYQVLETAIWIEHPNGGLVDYFYDARDRAYELGIMRNGELV